MEAGRSSREIFEAQNEGILQGAGSMMLAGLWMSEDINFFCAKHGVRFVI